MLIAMHRLSYLPSERLKKPMNKSTISVFAYSLALCGLVACTPEIAKKEPPIDFSALDRIQMLITNENNAAMPSELSSQVTKNLADWNYPVGEQAGRTFSHRLTANIGKVTFGNTPTGFSFSVGNSDPRATDFQKIDVLPIRCEITSLTHPEQTRALSMGFTSLNGDVRSLPSEKIVDHISTACFNLLSDLKWPEQANKEVTHSTKPGWFPEIRIETVETKKTIAPQETKESSLNSKTPANNEIPANSIQIVPTDESRKQIIIHNQGAPVIIQFGYERR